jgi:hypothetical protein
LFPRHLYAPLRVVLVDARTTGENMRIRTSAVFMELRLSRERIAGHDPPLAAS